MPAIHSSIGMMEAITMPSMISRMRLETGEMRPIPEVAAMTASATAAAPR